MRVVLILGVLGAAIGAAVSAVLYAARPVVTSHFAFTTDYPRRYVDYLPVSSGGGSGWWRVFVLAVLAGLVVGIAVGAAAAAARVRVSRVPRPSQR